MKNVLQTKLKEAAFAVVPITIIVLILCVILSIPIYTTIAFIVGAIMLVLGLSFFNLGAESSMMKLGEKIGGYVTKKKSLLLLIIVITTIGIMITIAEPDLLVLAEQLERTIPKMTLIIVIAIGVGLFLTFALLRILFQIPLNIILFVMYAVLFLVAAFAPSLFIPIAFDSGGVTTGPMTVPFILALGLGVASSRSDKSSKDDSFGLVAFCSIGPVLMVLILSLFYRNPNVDVSDVVVINSFTDFYSNFGSVLVIKIKEIAVAILPIVICTFVFMIIIFKDSKKNIIKMFIGLGYTYIGLVLFLAGANIGFMPIANMIGELIGESTFSYILIPLGMIMGFFVVMAEPAVHVLNKQVEEITSGAISKKVMLFSLAIGVAFSVGLSMARVVFDFSIWYIIVPGYLISLTLMFFVPKIFTAIAFDSGGVASGPMTATFLLPLAIGACRMIYHDSFILPQKILTNGFGVVALVAMAPLIVVQLVGLIYNIKKRIKKRRQTYVDTAIIDFFIDYEEMERKTHE